ncbi:MAG: InlB B-repeat-containing protein [Coriobacteriia bacterium]|nr:InlB B-repeat-containing protein [Coriobacteriia bacterium]
MPDSIAEPISWNCNARELICGNKDYEPEGPRLANNESPAAAGETRLAAAGGTRLAAAGETVRLKETDELFDTLEDAVAAANTRSSSVLEVIGDIAETPANNILITSDITIVGAEGAHGVMISKYIEVQGGGLTLGDDTGADPLTILGSVIVKSGTISVKDGITLRSDGNALTLSGPNASGTISGGRFTANGTSGAALSMEGGAKLSEISGGEFYGKIDAAHLSGSGTRIELISDGSFYQTDPDTELHGHAIFMQNDSQIGEISGGYFEAARNNALAMTRSSWVDEISGGEFVVKRIGSLANSDRNATVWVEGETSTTGIDIVSGGHFSGGSFGLLLIKENAESRINTITGGVFEGTIGLQNDVNCFIGEISGGQLLGRSQGLFNAGRIGKISEETNVLGTSSYGIYNYANATVDEISGGRIASEGSYGIVNSGTIKLISGGRIIGKSSAINCDGMNKGYLEKITNGVFWGKNDTAIVLAHRLLLEPELSAKIGLGRYWGENGVAFNNEGLVEYPGNYHMSTRTKPVPDINEVQFKYLTLPVNVVFDTNGGNFIGGAVTDARTVDAGEMLHNNMPGDPVREGYTFQGWNTQKDGTGDEFTGNTTVIDDITVYAQWVKDILPVNFVFQKVNETDTPMEGVVFELYSCPDGDDPYHAHDWLAYDGVTGRELCCWSNPVTVASDANGIVEFLGLEPGDYMLVETKTLSGYQLPLGQWLITVSGTTPDITIDAHGFDSASHPPAFKSGADDSLMLPNYRQMVMPHSGGTGAFILMVLTVIGITLVGSAPIYAIFTRSRKRLAQVRSVS